MAVDCAIVAQGREDGATSLRPAVDRQPDLYVVRSGCQWRQLPGDFPKWKTVYTVFWRWRKAEVWKNIHDALRSMVRKAAGTKRTPSFAIIDSQSIRTAEGGDDRGYDAGKKIAGRKRHIAVDMLGLIGAVVVHAAHWQDQEGAHLVAHSLRSFPRLKVIFGDSANGRSGFPQWVATTFGWIVQTVLRSVQASGFVVLPKRWIVERTFARLARYRRHSRDYEHRSETSETMIHLSMIALMSLRLARQNGD
jgi:putative transposase